MQRRMLALTLCAAAVAGSFAFLRAQSSAIAETQAPLAAAPAAPGDADLRRLTDQMAGLQAEVAMLHRELARRPEPRADTGVGTPPPDLEQQQAARREHMRSVEQEFAAQSTTRESVGREADLHERLAADDALADAVRDVRCRAEPCRVELDAGDPAVGAALQLFLLKHGAALPRVVANEIVQPDGTRRQILYLSRASNAPLPAKPTS